MIRFTFNLVSALATVAVWFGMLTAWFGCSDLTAVVAAVGVAGFVAPQV